MAKQVNIVIEQSDKLLTVYCSDPNAEVRIVQQGGVVACGCCGSHHREDFHGDCRNDEERLAILN